MNERIINDSEEQGGAGLISVGEKNFDKGKRAVGSFVRKVGARNIVIVCSLILIGAAIILNFVLFGNSKPIKSDGDPLGDASQSNEQNYVADTYFASAQLSRQQARDQAIAVLQTVVESVTADVATKEQATLDIGRIASEIQTEANIETLIKSKGFEECVAVISQGNASIIVRSDGLLQNELSQIKEIVYEQAGINPINIKIIEKKST